MNCINHTNDSAVATCPDCCVGLCGLCSRLYADPVCSSCNQKRIDTEDFEARAIKKQAITVGVMFGIFCLIPGCVMIEQGRSVDPMAWAVALMFPILGALWGATIPFGWRALSRIQPRMFLFMSFFGWMMYYYLKFVLSYFVGPVAAIRYLKKRNKRNAVISEARKVVDQSMKSGNR